MLLPGSRGNRRKGATLFDAVSRTGSRRRARRAGGHARQSLPRGSRARRGRLGRRAHDVGVRRARRRRSRKLLRARPPSSPSPSGDVPETISGLPGCFVSGREVGSLAAAVLRALEAPGGPALRARAEEFARPLIAQRVIRVYEQVLGGSRPAAASGRAFQRRPQRARDACGRSRRSGPALDRGLAASRSRSLMRSIDGSRWSVSSTPSP